MEANRLAVQIRGILLLCAASRQGIADGLARRTIPSPDPSVSAHANQTSIKGDVPGRDRPEPAERHLAHERQLDGSAHIQLCARGHVDSRIGGFLRRDEEVAGQRIDHQRLGIVGSVRISHLDLLHRDCGENRRGIGEVRVNRRLREAEDSNRGTVGEVVPDVSEVNVLMPGTGAGTNRDVLKVPVEDGRDIIAPERSAIRRKRENASGITAVVMRPEHAGVLTAGHNPGRLGDFWSGDGSELDRVRKGLSTSVERQSSEPKHQQCEEPTHAWRNVTIERHRG